MMALSNAQAMAGGCKREIHADFRVQSQMTRSHFSPEESE